MVYSGNTYEEYLLPAVDNSDYYIVLKKEQFGFSENYELQLEVVDGKWKFIKNGQYIVSSQNGKTFGMPLEHGDIFGCKTRGDEGLTIIVIMEETHLQVYQKYWLSYVREITIGNEPQNTIQYNFYGLVSRRHARIVSENDGTHWIEECGRNGFYINGVRVQGKAKLKFGDNITITGMRILYLGNVIGITAVLPFNIKADCLQRYTVPKDEKVTPGKRLKKKKNYFHRSPRTLPVLFDQEISIENPPAKHATKKKPLLMTIGPSFTMAIPMMMGSMLMIFGNGSGRRGITSMTGMVTALCSAIVGVTWAVVNLKYSKEEEKKEEEGRFGVYSRYLIEISDEIKEKYIANGKVLNESYPSADVCTEYGRNSQQLWNRNDTQEDFLFTRLGIGDVEFQAPIKIPKKAVNLSEDELSSKPKLLKELYKVLHDVPIGMDFRKERIVGLVGGQAKKGAYELARIIITQLAATACYTDVKIVVAYQEQSYAERKQWSFAKWLPHLWSDDRKNRFFATNKSEASDVFYEVANIIRMREEKKSQFTDQNKPVKPQIMMFISDVELLEGELISKYVLDPKEEYGITTFFLAEKMEDLPNQCETIIEKDEMFSGIFEVEKNKKTEINFDMINDDKLEAFSRRLADIEVKVADSGGEIPNSLDFFEMHGVGSLREFNVLDRWKKNRTYESMKALIGKKSATADCYLDIHEKYHGPHGLIAGTTGSGKSETLQTYMLSLAINFSPYDVGFFIIDFKGGGMANLFTGLPHTIGQISNLSGNQVRRAMVSIKSENKRRQRIFNEHGVNNINLYTRLVKNNEASIPIPHLFIIIDEFAELKREEPEFMKELISVAQVGRSLGVHLILATQKPSGTVDDNIWSNTKFRLCLRVADKADSNDMLHKPDAAFITQAGRCYLQVGNDEIYELFQSGWSGATYDESELGGQDCIATMLTVTGKTAIIGSKNKIRKQERLKIEWITFLVGVIREALAELSLVIERVKADSSQMTQLTNTIFEILEKKGIEYAVSKQNRIKLETLITLWPEMGGDDKMVAETIVKTAAQQKKQLPETKEKTQLDAVVEYLAEVAAQNGYNQDIQLWMPLLPTKMYLCDLDGYEESCFDGENWKKNENWTLETEIGLCDDPENQAQMPLKVSFSDSGHHAVCGSVVSGKSTFMQSVIYGLISKYTPEHVNFYLMDFSSQMLSAFEGCAHVGGVMFESDLDRIDKCFNLICQMLEERKKIFRGGSYSQYVKVNGVVIPAIIVAIDNMANFREKTGDKYHEKLLMLTRDSANYGIYFFFSSAGYGSSEIPTKIKDNIRTTICLDMGGDRFKYSDTLSGPRFSIMPEPDIKGRGLAIYEGEVLEFQTAMALPANDDYERSTKIKEACKVMSEKWTGHWAKVVPEIPEEPIFSEFVKLPEYKEYLNTKIHLPIGYNQSDASMATIDLTRTFCYMISGKKKTGKTNFVKILVEDMKQIENSTICIFDEENGRLKRIANQYECDYVVGDQETYDFWTSIIPEFKRRSKLRKDYIAQDLEEEEVNQKMLEEDPIFVIIGDLQSYFKNVYSPGEGIGKMGGFMENMMEKGANHGIYFFVVAPPEVVSQVNVKNTYVQMKKHGQGIHLGGNVSGQRVFSFSNISYKEESKVFPLGVGLVPSAMDESISERVIIPLMK